MSKQAVRRFGAMFLSVLMLVALTPRTAFAQAGNPTSVPVTGTFGLGGVTQNFSGFFNIQEFANQNGQLVAIGTLTETAGAAGGLPLTLPVTIQQTPGTCEILTLVLGPLHLDLLGLVIDLNQVELEITAEQGPGNLLGNLLCAIVGLLDNVGGGGGGGGGGNPLNAIVNLLNQILGILQGL